MYADSRSTSSRTDAGILYALDLATDGRAVAGAGQRQPGAGGPGIPLDVVGSWSVAGVELEIAGSGFRARYVRRSTTRARSAGP